MSSVEIGALQMNEQQEARFDAKVAELVALCRPLEIPQILMVRRMTMCDPEALKWATAKQLEVVFTVILNEAFQRVGVDRLQDAADNQFEPMLPPMSEDIRDQDRWMLYSMTRGMLKEMTRPAEPEGPVTPKADLTEILEDEDEETRKFTGFKSMFDETISGYVRKTLKVLAVNSIRPHVPPPFYVAPGFDEVFVQAIRKSVLPPMRGTRAIKDIAESRNWTKEGNGRLISMIQANARDNPIRFQWDSQWDSFKPGAPKSTKAKPVKQAEPPWPLFAEHATKHDYVGPDDKHVWMLKTMLRWDAEAIANGWRELAQLYQQEYAPTSKHDAAREGAFRDGICKWITKLPAHAGEALAVKAFFECPKCDRIMMRKIAQTFGMEAVRKKVVPLLVHFIDHLPQ
jgi:hypothetical protein